jgi:hypothetical protein
MCRSIKTLRHADVVATDEEIRAAARQFVRKVSGFREPSTRHQAAFEGAVDEITLASQRLLDAIAVNLPARHSLQAGQSLQAGLTSQIS